MTGTAGPPKRDDDDRIVAAGELALGLARKQDMDRARQADPALDREVERWEADFARLADELEPVPPRPASWTALSHAMRAGSGRGRRMRSIYDSLPVWRGLSGLGFATAVALAVALVLPRAPLSGPPATRVLLLAAILPKDGPPLFTATYDPSRRIIIVIPAAVRSDGRGTMRLWIVRGGDDDPVPLAGLNEDRPTVIEVSAQQDAEIKPDANLVVTSDGTATEPGPVLAHGRLEGF